MPLNQGEADRYQYWDIYKNEKSQLNYLIRRAKRESWRSFCEEIDDSSSASRLRKILAKDCSPPTYIKQEDGNWAENSEEVASTLMDVHFPGSTNISSLSEEEICRGWSKAGLPLADCRRIVTEEKIRWAIFSFKPYKSAGPDGIFPAMIQNSFESIKSRLIDIFIASLNLGFIPQKWRNVKVVFIPKAGRSGHVTAKDYRPISLSSFMLKTMERLVDFDIRNSIVSSLLSQSQHAYLKGKSTETALHKAVSCLEESLDRKEFSLAAFLDIEGAFNNVEASAIMKGLEAVEVPGGLRIWIEHMLTSRIVSTDIGSSGIKRSVTRGTPQGGVISPLLWLLVVNDLLRKMENKGVTVIGYADDIIIIARGSCINTIRDLIEGALKLVSSWTRENGLGVNASKTELVLFTRRYKIPEFRLPKLEGETLSISNQAKFLGVQRTALLGFVGSMKSTPTIALEVL